MLHPSSSMASFMPSSHGLADWATIPLRSDIENALSHFGCEALTTREQEVVHLILRGLPSKLIARALKITPKTVSVHRRNAYAKLEVDSRSTLFFDFLRFLSDSEPDARACALRSQRPEEIAPPCDCPFAMQQ